MTDLFDAPIIFKAVSLWQPWASLIAVGYKRHETRHWPMAYRGQIAIHAAKTLDVAGAPENLCAHAFGHRWRSDLPRGHVVAVGVLTACHRTEDVAAAVTQADYAAGNFAPKRFAWTIDDVRPLRIPVRCVGRQGLFNWHAPGELDSLLLPVIDHAAIAQTFEPLSRGA